MASSAKLLRMLSFSHVALAILAIITGIASMNVTEYYNGVFGMGIWLGGWILVTGLAGMASAVKPGNYCRIGVFLGCCLVAIVILSICSIIIGTVVIKHFQFESTVTRDYYKDRGTFGQRSHDDYFKPEEYFRKRQKDGRIGLGVYGCLLVITLADVLLCLASVYVCRDLTLTHGQAAIDGSSNRRVPSTRHAQANPGVVPIADLGLGGQNWAELVFQGFPSGTVQPVQFIPNPEVQFFTPYKLPNYAELYPEGISNPAVTPNEQAPVPSVPDEPPPAYTPTANPSLPQQSTLPGSPAVVHNSNSPPTPEHSIVEESTILATNLTSGTEQTRSVEAPDVTSHQSSEHPGASELTQECPGSSSPVHALQPGDLESDSAMSVNLAPSRTSLEANLSTTAITAQGTSIPNALVISSDSSEREIQNCVECDSSGSLPNSVEVEDLDGQAQHEAQNGSTTSLEIKPATDASEPR